MSKKREHKPAQHTQETKDKISKSLLNNSNAEYWTRDLVISTLDEMIEFLNTDIEDSVSVTEELSAIRFGDNDEAQETAPKQVKYTVKKITTRPHLKKEARLHFKIYNPNWFDQMADKFAEDTTVSLLLKTLDDIVEVNTYNSAAKGSANPIMAKANLSRHHGWVDKTENVNKDVALTDEELEARAKAYEKRNK
jgi:hypothetical protein